MVKPRRLVLQINFFSASPVTSNFAVSLWHLTNVPHIMPLLTPILEILRLVRDLAFLTFLERVEAYRKMGFQLFSFALSPLLYFVFHLVWAVV